MAFYCSKVLKGFSMTFKVLAPLGRILVEEEIVERKSSGGIILSGDSDPENVARFGIIKSNNILRDGYLNGVYTEGHKVFFGKFAGGTIVFEGKKYISLLETEILAVHE